MDIFPSGVTELEGLLPNKSTPDESAKQSTYVHNPSPFDSQQYEKYILKVHIPSTTPPKSEEATDADILRGMFHAYTSHTLHS